MNRKKIVFHSKDTRFDIMRPSKSSANVPEWFRKMPGVSENIQTIKKCVPFLDSLTLGYQIPLPTDIIWDKKEQEFKADSKIMLFSEHFPSQIEGVSIPEEYDPRPHKWSNYWHIKTPKGYSTLFIHPLNRMDLPFYSFSGVVDTDKHPLLINFPFVLRKDFDGVIKAGTPMIQAIPFKRNKWNMDVLDQFASYAGDKDGYKVSQPPFGWYKKNVWNRKEF
jgi:hypothetical protein